jgi:quinol monooxygenase YgiN
MNKKSSELIGTGRFKLREGKGEEYIRLAVQCMEIAQTKDKGTLQYEIYFNEDQSEVMFIERYKDSDSLIEHFMNLGNRMEAILATITVIHGELLGEPNEELKMKLAGSEFPHLFSNRLSYKKIMPNC